MNLPRHCPHCGSSDLALRADQKVDVAQSGFDLLYACLGTLIAGPFGLLCGLCGMGNTKVTASAEVGFRCNRCGHQFSRPGELHET